jgi:hypothetical protein
MKNSLRIKSEKWPEVTNIPHYIVEINYEGFSYVHSDIYFDNRESIVSKLNDLELNRKGNVEINGGFRFKIITEAKKLGGIVLNFRCESDETFPGNFVLEGYFSVEGENTASVVSALINLLSDGNEFVI